MILSKAFHLYVSEFSPPQNDDDNIYLRGCSEAVVRGVKLVTQKASINGSYADFTCVP